MSRKITIRIDREEILEALRLIKKLSCIPDQLEAAVEYALFYANSEEQKKITFIQELIRGLASGTVELSFDIYKTYRELAV